MPIGEIEPTPIHPDEPPFVCIQINPAWIPYLIGVLKPMRYPEYWSGTLEENRQARFDSNNLINQIMQAEECDDMVVVNCCCQNTVILHQVNPVTLQLEISIDNGETWQPDPESAVNTAVAQPPPVPAGISATKCDAATNGASHIGDIIIGCSEQLETALTIFELAVGVCEILLGLALIIISGGLATPAVIAAATALAGAIWAAATAVFNMGKAAFDTYWTQDEKDKILCALYCAIGDNGALTQAEYDQFINKWKSLSTPSPAFNFVLQAVLAIGLTGLNNLCAYGNAANADCSSCDCACTTGWELSHPEQGDTMTIVGDKLELTTGNIGLDGKYHVTIQRSAGCNEGCHLDGTQTEIISGGDGYFQCYWNVGACGENDFICNIDLVCAWKLDIKFNEPTVIRIAWVEC